MDESSFSSIVETFVASDRERLDTFLVSAEGLEEEERGSISREAARALRAEAHAALVRVLVLEMHAANLAGSLPGDDPQAQFRAFLLQAAKPPFKAHLRDRYPALERLGQVLAGRRIAIERLVSRMLADREELARHFGMSCDRLMRIELGLGDAHDGGATVAKLDFKGGGSLIYKPRPMKVDAILDAFLDELFPAEPNRIRVPRSMDRGDYGWAACVAHEFCRNEAELSVFYRNIGHWIAVMHLLGGTDIHCENLIAAGPVPVVVDPECLFARECGSLQSPQGAAHGEAARLLAASVLRTSIVPHRLPYAAFNGVDISSIGATADQQPEAMAPSLVGEGTTNAHIADRPVRLQPPSSVPSPSASFSSFMEEIADGFVQATHRLRDLDRGDRLLGLMKAFKNCRMRVMYRPTQLYVELRLMLWHPASLHAPEKADARAMEALSTRAQALSLAPEQVVTELSDLQFRDIPVFRSEVTIERIASALAQWREDEVDFQEMLLRSALRAAELNARAGGGRAPHRPQPGRTHPTIDSDVRAVRYELLQRAVRRLLKSSIRAADGSTTWLGISLGSNGWMVEPLGSDFYGGLGGIAFALAGYRHEMMQARVEPIDGLPEALDGCVMTMRAMERVCRPPGNGGYIGLGANIWQWLLLHSLFDRPELLGFAVECAESLIAQDLARDDGQTDLLGGDAGLIVPLIQLAAATGESRWLDVAANMGRKLERAALVGGVGVRWKDASFESPIGGFAHGATGIGWALARLSISRAGSIDDRQRWSELAHGAFRFEASLYDERQAAWRDLRMSGEDVCSDAWCHGGIGIGMAASDLYARTGQCTHLETMRLAVASALKHGWRRDVSLCHGSLGLRELLFRANRLDNGHGIGLLNEVDQIVLSEVSRFLRGADKMAVELFVPGLMTGLAGVIHGLCRMHPECELPSPLLMEVEPGVATVVHSRDGADRVTTS
jgi:type 2 lantibiotic biosynthesis protein LanM